MADPTQSHADWLAETFARNRARFGGWFMEADPATPPADPATPPGGPAAPPTPTDPAADAGKTPPWGKPENFDADKAWELIQNLRTEKGADKVSDLEQQLADMQTAQKAQMDAMAKALGLKPDDSPPDPAKLAEQVTASQAETATEKTARQDAERQLAVFKSAGPLEGNASALLDSASFLASIKDIDPTDDVALGEAITKAVEANPLFKVNATPATPPFHGGPRPTAPARAGSLEEAVAARLASTNR